MRKNKAMQWWWYWHWIVFVTADVDWVHRIASFPEANKQIGLERTKEREKGVWLCNDHGCWHHIQEIVDIICMHINGLNESYSAQRAQIVNGIIKTPFIIWTSQTLPLFFKRQVVSNTVDFYFFKVRPRTALFIVSTKMVALARW